MAGPKGVPPREIRITEEAFRRADEALTRAVAAADGPVERVEASCRERPRLGAGGAHRRAAAPMNAGLPPACLERLRGLRLKRPHRSARPSGSSVTPSPPSPRI
ncbi:hypothetical protein SUDANB146_06264 [Streptomyces sp. enrichment culture]